MGRLNRRIPNELRKRTAQSCDLCKTRRCKCVPSGQGKTCVSCLDQGIECQYTAPRKQRFYGSLDDLSDRYRCLEAILKGAFPDDATATVNDLVQLGERLNCPMPDLSSDSRKDIKAETLVRDPDLHFPATTSQFDTTRGADYQGLETKQTDYSPVEDQGSLENETTPPAVFKDSAGNEHYIGPSGTLNFLHRLRQVFAATAGPTSELDHSPPIQLPSLSTTQTLEAEENGSTFDTTRSSLGDWQEALSLLPPIEILQPMIDGYFQHTHEDFPLFHRPSFDRQYNFYLSGAAKDIASSQRSEYQVPDWGWLGCLYMILVFGSIAQPEVGTFDHPTLQKQYVAASRVLLPQLVSKCSLNNIRCLILLALYLHNNNERNASWNLTGAAIRIAFAIGLHRKSQSTPTSVAFDQHSRILVLSTLYSFELFLAANLGRPSSLSETDIEVFPLSAAERTDGSGTDPELISLTVGLNSILQRTRLMYAKRKPTYGGNSDPTVGTGVDDIQERLQRWREDLKRHRRFDIPTIRMDGRTGSYVTDGSVDYEDVRQSLRSHCAVHPRALLMLHVQFHYIGIITTRHFLLHDIAAARLSIQGGADSISTLAQSCVLHAHQLSFIFLIMDDFGLVNGRTGLDVFYGYWAGMLLNLMLLWPKSEHTAVPEPGQPCPLRSLVNRVHSVVTRVDKSGTMQRLSSVMDGFVAWAGSVDGKSDYNAQQRNGPESLTEQGSLHQRQHEATSRAEAPKAAETRIGQTAGAAAEGSDPWTQTGSGFAPPPMFGLNMGFPQLPPGSNGATAFLNSFLGPDDQAAMLGMMDLDSDAQTSVF